MNQRILTAVCAVGLFQVSIVNADDWPQWRGPNRDGISKETGLLKEWPKEGPKLLWSAKDLGSGYSTPSIVGGKVFLISARGDDEFCQALDAKTGTKVWEVKIGGVGKNQIPPYPGSRSTPTIDGNVLYALSSDGDLVCLETAKGEVKWSKNYKKDFGGAMGMWAFAESPLVDGELLICTPGGKEATLIALKKSNGEVVWKSPAGGEAGYASPQVATLFGKKQYITFLSNGVVGVDAADGKVLWRYAATSDKAANIMTPVIHDNALFSSARPGAALIQFGSESAEYKQVYFGTTLVVSMGGAIRIGDFLYGTSGQAGQLTCAEFKTGKEKWKEKCVGPASLCYADGHLFLRSHADRTVAIVEATPDGFKEKGRFIQPEKGERQGWPHPVIANGCLYLRDQGFLFCYDVKAPKSN
jgi:outer membrane protein assembly factor BamB